MCDKGFIWNLSNCGCECDKSYDVGEYLDYENYKCRKKLIDKLVEECSENIDEKEIYPNKAISLVCNSWTMYIILFSVFSTIGTVLIYFYWYSKMKSLLIWHSNKNLLSAIEHKNGKHQTNKH